MTDLPKNLQAERGLLGVIITQNDAIFTLGDIEADDFFETYNGELFKLLKDQIEGGRDVTSATLLHEAQDNVIWGDIRASEYLSMLERDAPPARMAPELSRTIQDIALRRRIIVAADEIKRRTLDAPVSLPAIELREELDESMSALFPTVTSMGLQRAVDVGDTMLDDMKKPAEQPLGLSFGIQKLEDLIGPLMPGRLYMCAAPAGGGKSALFAQMALHIAASGRVATIFSLEMSAVEIVQRTLAAKTGIKADRIERSIINNAEYEQLYVANEDWREGQLYIDESSRPTMPMIRGRALRKKRMGGLDAVFIDHIHYVAKSDRRMGDNEALDENLMLGKQMAKDLGVPVIAACHFGTPALRSMEKWPHPRPTKGDILFFGTVDRHADVTFMIHRPEYFLEQNEPPEGDPNRVEWIGRLDAARAKAEIILGKRRGGKGFGRTTVFFEAERTKFHDNDFRIYQPKESEELPF